MTPPLAILLKAPRLGMVKTRLAAEVGDRHALRLYRVMAGRALAAVRSAGLDAIIWFTPPESLAEMQFWLGDSWEFRPQAAGDLGVRLAAAARAVPRGDPWMAVCPDCPAHHRCRAPPGLCRSRSRGVVIGPTFGGGYYLVGGRTPLPDIFTAMPWGTQPCARRDPRSTRSHQRGVARAAGAAGCRYRRRCASRKTLDLIPRHWP